MTKYMSTGVIRGTLARTVARSYTRRRRHAVDDDDNTRSPLLPVCSSELHRWECLFRRSRVLRSVQDGLGG